VLKNLARRVLASAARCPLDLLGPPGWCGGCWPHDREVGGGADFILVISGRGDPWAAQRQFSF
jgi:hypothetical protein